ncbi:MAG TPA: response regulator [Pseudobacteroides sp.]|uniref:response regulator transcription factor n=1 Tax=Pseudobacteroides sp. TaxID=1968840 RepID=UPI002F940E37
MFKVIIIDDEPIIRRGLKNVIDWNKYDCEVCAEAGDGLSAIEIIKEIKPDIIFTDIKMPGMDGISMISEIIDLVPNSKIIILTGHRDFEFARDAIKYGVFEFLLKPSKIEVLNDVVEKAVSQLKSDIEKYEEINKLKVLFEQNIPILREKFLYDIIYAINKDPKDIKAKMELFGLEINNFFLILVENEVKEGNESSFDRYKPLHQLGIINTFKDLFKDSFDVISISLESKWTAFILHMRDYNDGYVKLVEEKCLSLQQIIQNYYDFNISVSVSSEGVGALELPAKLRECHEALRFKYYLGNNLVIFYKDLNSFFKYENYSLLEIYSNELLAGIKSGDLNEVRTKLQHIREFISSLEENERNMAYLKIFFVNVTSSINNIRLSINAVEDDKGLSGSSKISSFYIYAENCENIKDLNSLLEEVAIDVASKINNFNNKRIKLMVQKAVDYLHNHYNEPITLGRVAENIYVSSFYLSRMFKKELGKNFIDFLNEIRVEKSKELLKDGKFKTYEIAQLVGFSDSQYFSKTFKKYANMTPTEYRESNNRVNEK